MRSSDKSWESVRRHLSSKTQVLALFVVLFVMVWKVL